MPRPVRRKTATVLSISTAKAKLSEVVQEVRYTGTVALLTRHGKNVAAIVPMADYDKLVEAA